MRSIVAAFALVLALFNTPPRASTLHVETRSPGGRLRFLVTSSQTGASGSRTDTGSAPHLAYELSAGGRSILLVSRAGIVVDGVDMGQDVEISRIERRPCRLRDADVLDAWPSASCTLARLHLVHRVSKLPYTLEARVFDDGLAFRYEVPGSAPRVADEGTTFHLPPGSTVWYHDLDGHYEGVHVRKAVAEVPPGAWAAPPLTFKLAGEGGYASITEAALQDYAGMALQANGASEFVGRLGHAHPVSKPYALRFPPEEAKRLAVPASAGPPILTPWRVVLVGRDLNALVKAQHVITDVSPAPDPQLFTGGRRPDWVKPGRAVWRFLDGGDNTVEGLKGFSDLAARLGFEYQVVEGVWQKWSPEDLRAFVDYSRSRGVGIWLWKDSRAIRDTKARREFFDLCQSLGVVGAKIDFLDHEAKDTIDFYHTLLREAAAHRIMVAFHGANKPTGEVRTWLNELTREAVFGLEHRSMQSWAQHNTTLPFTRYLAGPGDYTPVVFGERRRDTSWAHQIATAAVFTSPLLVYGGHPQSLLDNPGVEMIRSVPSVWDETIVLPPSEIGEIAVLARRSGRTWFLAVLNGPAPRTLHLTPAFLAPGRHATLLVRDVLDDPAALTVERGTALRTDTLTVALRAGGGFIARFGDSR